MDTKFKKFIKLVAETFEIDTAKLHGLAKQAGYKSQETVDLTSVNIASKGELEKLNVKCLKDICRALNFKVGGKKDELVMRILSQPKLTFGGNPPENQPESKLPLDSAAPVAEKVVDQNSEEYLSTLTNSVLKEMCREKDLQVGGKKAELVARILGKDFYPELLASKEKAALDRKKMESNKMSAEKIVRDESGFYIHGATQLAFDPNSKKVIGKKNSEGDVVNISEEDMEVCRDYKFDFVLPTNLDEICEAIVEEESEELEEEQH